MSWYQVLWARDGGNVYYTLAHAYVATRLNLAGGTPSTPEVDSALADATAFFNTYAPAEVGEWRGNHAERKAALGWKDILDSYNNGRTGPGHCTD